MTDVDIAGQRVTSRPITTAHSPATDWAASGEVLQASVARDAFAETLSCIIGANIAGKKQQAMFYLGGVCADHDMLRETAAAGFKGFEFAE